MESRFFERIAKTYRKERWDVVLRPLLTIWYSCAQQTGNVELSVQLLLEMLGHGKAQDYLLPFYCQVVSRRVRARYRRH